MEANKNNVGRIAEEDKFRQGLFLFIEAAKCYESGFYIATALMCRTTIRYFMFTAINKIEMRNIEGPDVVKELASKNKVTWSGKLGEDQKFVGWDTLVDKADNFKILDKETAAELGNKIIDIGDRVAHIDEREAKEISDSLDKIAKESGFGDLKEGEISGPVKVDLETAKKILGAYYMVSEKEAEQAILATKAGIVKILSNYFKIG